MFFVNHEIANGVDRLFKEDAQKFKARFSTLDENGLPTWISLFGKSHYEDVNADLRKNAASLVNLLVERGIDLHQEVSSPKIPAWAHLLKEKSIFTEDLDLFQKALFPHLSLEQIPSRSAANIYEAFYEEGSKDFVALFVQEGLKFDAADSEVLLHIAAAKGGWLVPMLNKSFAQMNQGSELILRNLTNYLKNFEPKYDDCLRVIFDAYNHLRDEDKVELLKVALQMKSLGAAEALSQKMGNPPFYEGGIEVVLPLIETCRNRLFIEEILEKGLQNKTITSKYGSVPGMLALSKAAHWAVEAVVNVHKYSDFDNAFMPNTGKRLLKLMKKSFSDDLFDALLQKDKGKPILDLEREGVKRKDGHLENLLMILARSVLPEAGLSRKHDGAKDARAFLLDQCQKYPDKMREMAQLCFFEPSADGERVPAEDFYEVFWNSKIDSLSWGVHLDILMDQGILSKREVKSLLKQALSGLEEKCLPDISSYDWHEGEKGVLVLDPICEALCSDKTLDFSDWEGVDFDKIRGRGNQGWEKAVLSNLLPTLDRIEKRVERDLILGKDRHIEPERKAFKI